MGAPAIKKTAFVVGIGSSLFKGYLSGYWVPKLIPAMRARGLIRPVQLVNLGKGSQTSDYIIAMIPEIISHNPTHILLETNAINDAAPSLFSGGIAGHTANMDTIITTLSGSLPGVVITLMTMSPGPGRPDLAAMYQVDRDKAVQYNIGIIDNYPNWPNPLPAAITNGGDTLHPLESATDVTLLPFVADAYVAVLNAWNGGL
jgi:hypothetical protein